MNNFKIYFILLGLMLAVFACQPEDFSLGKKITPDELTFTITQNPEDPNMIILRSLTPGATPLWITPMGRSTKMQDTVKIPFEGEYTFIYGVQSAGGFVQAEPYKLVLTTSNLNYVNDPLWTLLSGGVGNEKTWVLDLDENGVSKYFSGPLYFYGTAHSWASVTDGVQVEGDNWNWNPDWKGNTWLMPAGDYGTMTFNLQGNANVIVNHKMLDRVEQGTYFLDVSRKMLTMSDAGSLHDAGRDGQVIDWGNLKLMSLTENTLQLAALRDEGLSGEGAALFVYNFISKEYADNWVPDNQPDPEPPYDGNANVDLTTNTSTSKKWVVDTNYPYNWHNLKGEELNVVTSYGNESGGFAFSSWTPPYDRDVFESISIELTKGGANDGNYIINIGSVKHEGTYSVDNKNNINFGKPISFFSEIGGWLSFTTTSNNDLRIIKADKDALGNVVGIWLGQRSDSKDEYLSLHLKAVGGGGGVDPEKLVKELICAKTWKIDSERSFNVTTSWGAESGPVIFSDFSTWAWNPLPGEHYAAGEAGINYGTVKFETNGKVQVKQRKRVYTYDDAGVTKIRNGSPQPGDVLASDDIVTINGIWVLDLDAKKITLSVGMLHPWTCDYAVADWGALSIHRIEENALLLQVLRDPVLSGEGEFLITYVFVPAN